ncbi:hypothetical protein DOLIC_00066 [Dolichomitus sp. PSUC_FEM 10030005]|nr:hypothetical protein [Dolichomitus sp. PSUC_FEM 10030005]
MSTLNTVMSDKRAESQDLFIESDDSVDAIAGTPQHCSRLKQLLLQQIADSSKIDTEVPIVDDGEVAAMATVSSTAASEETLFSGADEESVKGTAKNIIATPDKSASESRSYHSPSQEGQIVDYDIESIMNEVLNPNGKRPLLTTHDSALQKRRRLNDKEAIEFENNFSIFKKFNSIKGCEEIENRDCVKSIDFYNNYDSSADIRKMEHFTDANDEQQSRASIAQLIVDLTEDTTLDDEQSTKNTIDNKVTNASARDCDDIKCEKPVADKEKDVEQPTAERDTQNTEATKSQVCGKEN